MAKNSKQSIPTLSIEEIEEAKEELNASIPKLSAKDLEEAAQELKESIGSEGKPYEGSLYNTDSDRVAHSFGDDKGKIEYLEKQGFSNVHYNKDGTLVGQKSNGDFFADAEGIMHPINWLENRAGKAIPTAGMIAGGVLGGGATKTIPGAMKGAGVGSAAGEGVRQLIGKGLGTYKGDAYDQGLQIAEEGAMGAVSEGVGQVAAPFVNPLLKKAASTIAKGGKSVVSSITSFNTAVPKKAVEKLIERPDKVMQAVSDPEFALQASQRARTELAARDKIEDQAIQQARRTFKNTHGKTEVDTKSVIDDLDRFIDTHKPTKDGYSALLPGEQKQLADIRDNAFSTIVPQAASKSGQQALSLFAPKKSAADLQKFADYLATVVKNFDQSKLPGTGDTRFQAYIRNLYGHVKDKLHKLDPQGLGAADKRFSDYADKASFLRSLEQPKTSESFVDNFYGRNKEQLRQYARELIPNSMDDLEAISAAKAFGQQGPAGSPKGNRSIFGNVVGGSIGLHGLMHSNGGEIMAGMAVKGATSPAMNLSMIGNISQLMDKVYGSGWFKTLYNDPKLIQTITDVGLREGVEKLLRLNQDGAASIKVNPQEYQQAILKIDAAKTLNTVDKAKAINMINRSGKITTDYIQKILLDNGDDIKHDHQISFEDKNSSTQSNNSTVNIDDIVRSIQSY